MADGASSDIGHAFYLIAVDAIVVDCVAALCISNVEDDGIEEESVGP